MGQSTHRFCTPKMTLWLYENQRESGVPCISKMTYQNQATKSVLPSCHWSQPGVPHSNIIVSLGMMWFRDQELSSSCWWWTGAQQISFHWGRRGLCTLLHMIFSFMTLLLHLVYNRPPLKLIGLKLRGSKPLWFIIAYNSVDWQSEGFFCSTFNTLT